MRIWFDSTTGLHWEIKSLSAGDVNYCEDTYSFDEAQSLYTARLNAINYGGFSDWRIPNKDELRSVLDYNRINPAINTDIFTGCKPDDYWTRNTYEMQPDFAWVLFFGFGSAIAKVKSARRYVMACRGQADSLFGIPDPSRFTVHQDGTVSDTATGLMWQQGENPRMNFAQAYEACKNLRLGGYTDWRLPTIKELNTILNLNYNGDTWYFRDIFPAEGLEPPLLHYISSTTFQNHFAWVTNFCFGYDGYYASKGASLLFRAVRTEYPTPTKNLVFSDPNTGLMWERPQHSQVMSWEQAQYYVKQLNDSSYAGYSDWRLPQREELRTIVDYNNTVPAVNTALTDDTAVDFYWANETKKDEPELAWGIYFGYGCAICFPKTNPYHVRAVRGKSFSNNNALTDNGDGTISDPGRDLMWMKAETPLLTTEEAVLFCENLRLAGYDDWYLPDMKELGSLLLLEGNRDFWFDNNAFPDIVTKPQGFYLSSDIFGDTFGWGVNFQFGYDGYYADLRNGKYPIKPVRKISKD